MIELGTVGLFVVWVFIVVTWGAIAFTKYKAYKRVKAKELALDLILAVVVAQIKEAAGNDDKENDE